MANIKEETKKAKERFVATGAGMTVTKGKKKKPNRA